MERVKETIRFDTELVKLIWFALIADIGGTVSLMTNIDSRIKLVLVLIGAIVAIILAWWLIARIGHVRQLIQQLEE